MTGASSTTTTTTTTRTTTIDHFLRFPDPVKHQQQRFPPRQGRRERSRSRPRGGGGVGGGGAPRIFPSASWATTGTAVVTTLLPVLVLCHWVLVGVCGYETAPPMRNALLLGASYRRAATFSSNGLFGPIRRLGSCLRAPPRGRQQHSLPSLSSNHGGLLYASASQLPYSSSSSVRSPSSTPFTESNSVSPISFTESNGSDDSNGTNTSREGMTRSRSSRSVSLLQPLSLPPPLQPHDFPEWAYEPRDFFTFELLHQSNKPGSRARVGRIHTPHGVVDTPGFVAVATNGALKGVDWRQAHEANQQLVFCNTYHLLIHPGPDIVEEAGGLHKFTRHSGPLITDSGGFQVFSLAHGSVREDLTSQGRGNGELKQRRQRKVGGKRNDDAPDASTKTPATNNTNSNGKMVKVTEDGVWFRSYRDGKQFLLTPESTVLAQKKLGADIIVPLDELPGYYTERDELQRSLHRTHRWEGRSLQTHLQQVKNQAMYCVIHGGIDRQLRTESVDYLTSLPFDGNAIGGSLGNGRQELKELLEFLMPQLDTPPRRGKPRHLLGIADEESIRNAVPFGVDTLDSCYPTRVARHGTILTRLGSIKIGSGKYGRQHGVPLDEECQCSTCRHYDRAYLWHLFKAKEPLAITLATVHNLHYMNDLMKDLRDKIWIDEI